MRSSFYSTKFDDQSNNQGERKIVDSFKLSNILELSEQEK